MNTAVILLASLFVAGEGQVGVCRGAASFPPPSVRQDCEGVTFASGVTFDSLNAGARLRLFWGPGGDVRKAYVVLDEKELRQLRSWADEVIKRMESNCEKEGR